MQKILVCHTGAWIGDMVLLTPSLRLLKHTFPESNLILLLRPLVADLMKTNPYVDRCIVDYKTESRYRSFIRLVRKIREYKFDIAVVMHPTSMRNALLPFFAQVPIRVGASYKGRDIFLSATCQNRTEKHEVKKYLNVVNTLFNDSLSSLNGFERAKSGDSIHLEYWHTDEDRQSVLNMLNNEGVTDNDRLLAVNLGTTWRTKQWSVKNFDNVINQIFERVPNIKIVLVGSSNELSLVKNMSYLDATINLIDKTDILQLGALLEMCDVCLTCDSGPMHIAAAVGTPTVSLFGPTSPERQQPYGKGHTIIEKPLDCRPCYNRTCHRQDTQFLCMQEITVEEVAEEIIAKLNKKEQYLIYDKSVSF